MLIVLGSDKSNEAVGRQIWLQRTQRKLRPMAALGRSYRVLQAGQMTFMAQYLYIPICNSKSAFV